MFVVQLIEFERGWGSKVDEEESFTTEEIAKAYVETYNKTHNNEETVPDWYILASYLGERPDNYQLKK